MFLIQKIEGKLLKSNVSFNLTVIFFSFHFCEKVSNNKEKAIIQSVSFVIVLLLFFFYFFKVATW